MAHFRAIVILDGPIELDDRGLDKNNEVWRKVVPYCSTPKHPRDDPNPIGEWDSYNIEYVKSVDDWISNNDADVPHTLVTNDGHWLHRDSWFQKGTLENENSAWESVILEFMIRTRPGSWYAWVDFHC